MSSRNNKGKKWKFHWLYFYSPTLDQRFSPNDTIFGIDFDPTKPPQEPDLTDMPTAPELPQWQGAPDFNSNGNYTFTQNITVPDFADVYPEYAEFPQYKENRPEVPGDPGDLSGYVNQYLSVIGYLSPATYLQATSNRYTGQINGIMAQCFRDLLNQLMIFLVAVAGKML